MKTLDIRLFLLALTVGLLAGCRSGGDIGIWFGIWRIDAYEVDGQRQTDPLISRTCLAFQGEVVEVTADTDGHGSYWESYGTWSDDGNTFTLNFTHHDNAGHDFYGSPYWLGWDSSAPMVMTVIHRQGRNVTWQWTAPDGKVHIYKVKKTI